MTPKEKAKVLVERFWNDVTYQNEEYKPNAESRKCALICADEMMQNNYEELDFVGANYFKEVIEQINKL